MTLQRSSERLAHSDRPKVILLVEDEPLIRIMLAEEFRDAGFGVLEAKNATEALSFLGSALPIDLVCTDVRMPGQTDGLALARTVRSQRPRTKIIVVTGHLADPPPAEIHDAFFSKPYHPGRLVARAVDLLSGSPP